MPTIGIRKHPWVLFFFKIRVERLIVPRKTKQTPDIDTRAPPPSKLPRFSPQRHPRPSIVGRGVRRCLIFRGGLKSMKIRKLHWVHRLAHEKKYEFSPPIEAFVFRFSKKMQDKGAKGYFRGRDASFVFRCSAARRNMPLNPIPTDARETGEPVARWHDRELSPFLPGGGGFNTPSCRKMRKFQFLKYPQPWKTVVPSERDLDA